MRSRPYQNDPTLRPRCYLAGPMTGLPGYNFPAFIRATELLRKSGYEVISPVELDWAVYDYANPTFPSVEDVEAAGFDIHDTMRRDITAILSVDQVVLLPGWEKSSGVQKELSVAGFIGIPAYTYNEYHTERKFPFFYLTPTNSALAAEPVCNDPSHSEPFACHRQAEGGFVCESTIQLERLLARPDARKDESSFTAIPGPQNFGRQPFGSPGRLTQPVIDAMKKDAGFLTDRLAERHSKIQFNDSGMNREEYLDHMGKVADQQMPPDDTVQRLEGGPFPHPTVAFADEGVNPKDLLGLKKPPLRLVPAAAIIYMSRVMALGAEKYGPYNWRTKKIRRTVYLEAAMRHMIQALDGEDLDPESGMPHEAHAAACMGILLDALATGNLVDDRPTPGAAAELIRELTLA